jgi:hypothetical protein
VVVVAVTSHSAWFRILLTVGREVSIPVISEALLLVAVEAKTRLGTLVVAGEDVHPRRTPTGSHST